MTQHNEYSHSKDQLRIAALVVEVLKQREALEWVEAVFKHFLSNPMTDEITELNKELSAQGVKMIEALK